MESAVRAPEEEERAADPGGLQNARASAWVFEADQRYAAPYVEGKRPAWRTRIWAAGVAWRGAC